MKTKTHFAFRMDAWDGGGNEIVEHLAGLDNYGMAVGAYWAAVAEKPKEKITLRQSARVVMKTWTEKATLHLTHQLSALPGCGFTARF
jgi:hypothetical protein